MPRFRNLFDYSTEDEVHKPHETLIDVPESDSVGVITINFESGGFVQLRRLEDSTGPNEWQLITSLVITKVAKKSVANYSR